MLRIFNEAGEKNSRNVNYKFWQQDNQPKIYICQKFAAQKLEYIHNNPVEAVLVEKAEKYIYSSARDYYYGKKCGLTKILCRCRCSFMPLPVFFKKSSCIEPYHRRCLVFVRMVLQHGNHQQPAERRDPMAGGLKK